MIIKNQKIKNSKKGSESTISYSSTSNKISNIRTIDDQIPKSQLRSSSNPGGAIILYYNNINKHTTLISVMIYRSIRTSVWLDNTDFSKPLIQTLGQEELMRVLKGLEVQPVIAVFGCGDSDGVGCEFKIGQFYLEGMRLMWKQKHDDIAGLVDVMEAHSGNPQFFSSPLKLYEFYAGAATEDETISVIHHHPLLAYDSITHRRTTRHFLQRAELVRPGMQFDFYHSYSGH